MRKQPTHLKENKYAGKISWVSFLLRLFTLKFFSSNQVQSHLNHFLFPAPYTLPCRYQVFNTYLWKGGKGVFLSNSVNIRAFILFTGFYLEEQNKPGCHYVINSLKSLKPYLINFYFPLSLSFQAIFHTSIMKCATESSLFILQLSSISV